MKCPYGFFVDDPPAQYACPLSMRCYCRGDIEALEAGALDRQSIYVQKWWDNAAKKHQRDRAARHLQNRPTLEWED
jgi:hypothetical protein